MKRQTEQAMARHYLAHRQAGYSIPYVLRRSAGRYALLIGLLLLFLAGAYLARDRWDSGFCLWGIGVATGAFARDAGWLRRIKRQWPFTQKIINWQKVEEIAEGKE